jgi:hypothetical protein
MSILGHGSREEERGADRAKLEAELEWVRRQLRNLYETKLWLERTGVPMNELLEIEREIGQLRIRKEELERELEERGVKA